MRRRRRDLLREEHDGDDGDEAGLPREQRL